MKYLILAGIVGIPGAMIWAGIYFGSRWIDRLLCVRPPMDPNKPIVLPPRPMSDGEIYTAISRRNSTPEERAELEMAIRAAVGNSLPSGASSQPADSAGDRTGGSK